MSVKKKVLFFPSAWSNEEVFQFQAKLLGHEYDVIFPDIHSHQSIEKMAEFVINQYKNERIACLIGMSMGGYIIQEILTQAPDFAPKVIIISSSPVLADEAKTFIRGFMEQVKANGIESFVPVFAQAVLMPENISNSTLVNIVSSMPKSLGAEKCLNHHMACVSWKGATDKLPTIKAKTLILAGDKDTAIPFDQIAALTAIPGSKLITIENAAHFVTLEQPEIILKAIREFLSEARV